MQYVIAYVSTAVVLAVIDAVWLTTMGEKLYRRTLGPILVDGFRLPPAILFYVLFVAGVVIFAVAPALKSGQWTTALLMGALFGFFCYATYDLTNLATIKLFTWKIVMIDLAWGSFLAGVSATAAYFLTRKFGGA